MLSGSIISVCEPLKSYHYVKLLKASRKNISFAAVTNYWELVDTSSLVSTYLSFQIHLYFPNPNQSGKINSTV